MDQKDVIWGKINASLRTDWSENSHQRGEFGIAIFSKKHTQRIVRG